MRGKALQQHEYHLSLLSEIKKLTPSLNVLYGALAVAGKFKPLD